MKLAADRLPRSILQLAEQIGLAATLALVMHYAGKTLWPARTGAQRAHLAEIMGEEAAERFTQIFREPFTVPLCRDAARAVAQDALRAEFDRLTRAEGYSARAAVAALANTPPLYHTDRHIWRLLGQTDTGGTVIDARQSELF